MEYMHMVFIVKDLNLKSQSIQTNIDELYYEVPTI